MDDIRKSFLEALLDRIELKTAELAKAELTIAQLEKTVRALQGEVERMASGNTIESDGITDKDFLIYRLRKWLVDIAMTLEGPRKKLVICSLKENESLLGPEASRLNDIKLDNS